MEGIIILWGVLRYILLHHYTNYWVQAMDLIRLLFQPITIHQ